MSMLDSDLQTKSGAPDGRQFAYEETPAPDWLLFAGIMLALGGILNVIYGIAAIGDSSFFVNDAKYILSDLNTWGWVMLGLGALQIGAALSTWKGGSFGVWFGIPVAALNAIAALMSIPGYPFFSLAIFGLDILTIWALASYGGKGRPA